MAAAIQLGMVASPFLCATTIGSKRLGLGSTESACGLATPKTIVVCQQENKDRPTADVSRRVFAVAAASATAVGIFAKPEAKAAARRKPPPPEEKKVEEDKGLSAYDQRLLANARRKEAMKAKVEAAKAEAKSIASAE